MPWLPPSLLSCSAPPSHASISGQSLSRPSLSACSADDSKCLHRLDYSAQKLMHDRPAGARPPLSTVCEASESTLLLLLLPADPPLVLVLLLVPQLTAAAECYGILLLLVSTACGAHLHPSSFVPLRASSVLVSDGPAPPPGPRLFACLGSRPLPYYLTSTPTPTVCLVLDALDIDSISSFYGSSILL